MLHYKCIPSSNMHIQVFRIIKNLHHFLTTNSDQQRGLARHNELVTGMRHIQMQHAIVPYADLELVSFMQVMQVAVHCVLRSS